MTELTTCEKTQGTETLKLLPSQKVLLIAGPAGSGKTSMGQRVAKVDGWYHLPEDRVWDELPREPHTARTDATVS